MEQCEIIKTHDYTWVKNARIGQKAICSSVVPLASVLARLFKIQRNRKEKAQNKTAQKLATKQDED